MSKHGLITSLLTGCLAASGLAAQSYGLGDQVLTVSAPSFRPNQARAGLIESDGYLYNSDPENENGHFYSAPVRLPDGAEITQICMYSRNEEADFPRVSLEVRAVKLAPGGLAPGVVPIPGSFVAATFNFGYGVVCTNPMSYVFHDDADVDNDGIGEHVAHHLRVLISAGATAGFGGARIVWHRQVSPAPATATFTDVPTDHQFFQFVEALVAAGITAGVGNGMYGVNNPITRGQMAVFLSKGLGLHWPQ